MRLRTGRSLVALSFLALACSELLDVDGPPPTPGRAGADGGGAKAGSGGGGAAGASGTSGAGGAGTGGSAGGTAGATDAASGSGGGAGDSATDGGAGTDGGVDASAGSGGSSGADSGPDGTAGTDGDADAPTGSGGVAGADSSSDSPPDGGGAGTEGDADAPTGSGGTGGADPPDAPDGDGPGIGEGGAAGSDPEPPDSGGAASVDGADGDTDGSETGAPPPLLSPLMRLVPTDTDVYFFGIRAAIEDDTALIGASDSTLAGFAWFVRRDQTGTWVFDQKITGNPPAPNSDFGNGLALSGNWAVVGAPGDGFQPRPGEAFFFEREPSGTWTVRQRIDANPPSADDSFGWDVDIQGDRAVIGVPGAAANRGAMYVYEREPSGNWVERARLVAQDGVPGDLLGTDVELEGDMIVVTAPGDDDTLGVDAGASYLFVRQQASGTWTAVEKHFPMISPATNFHFGNGTASFKGDFLLVGAAAESVAGPGAAYAFRRNSSGRFRLPDLIQTLLPPAHLTQPIAFGAGTAICGNYAVVGHAGLNLVNGNAFVYRNVGDVWQLESELADGSTTPDGFGVLPVCDGNTVIVPASRYGAFRGAVYFFTVQ